MNRNDDLELLANEAARALQDLNAVTSLRPVPALSTRSRRHGPARAGGRHRRLGSPVLAGVAVAVLVLGILVGIQPFGDGGRPPPLPPAGLLGPDAELNGMRLSIAKATDTDIFVYCDPIIVGSGTFTRKCRDIPQMLDLMIGHGAIDESAELLEQSWQAQRWQLYLDGRQVDLAAFGALPDRHYFESTLGEVVWVRQWAVTIINPTPGQHTLRYVMEQPPTGDSPSVATDTTWTFNVI